MAAILLVIAVLIGLRMPQVVISGRFWAEEGRVFFSNAWSLPPLQALLATYAGYLNLAANAAALAARWCMPLPLAPYATIGIALLIQLCPPLLILTARDAWLRPLRVKLMAVLLIILVPCAEEVWLQTLTSQFELALCCAIILALDEVGGSGRLFRRGVLVLAPLCGPLVVALLPLFILRALLDHSRERVIQTAMLGAGIAVQFVFFVHLLAGRGYSIHPVTLLCVIAIRHMGLPFLGVNKANILMLDLRGDVAAGHVPWLAVLLPPAILIPLASAAYRARRSGPAIWFLGACVCTAALSYSSAIGGTEGLFSDVRGGGRYYFVPQALLNLSLVALASTRHSWSARLSWIGIIWLLAIGAHEYTKPFAVISNGPAWREQVAAWRVDPKHRLQIWPDGWSMSLDAPRR